MVLRWCRDAVRLRVAADPERRTQLAEDLSVWRRALSRPGANPLETARPG